MSLPCIHDYHQLHICAHDLVTVFNMFLCQIPVMECSTTFVAWIFVAPPAMCYVSVFQQIVLITKGITTNITLVWILFHHHLWVGKARFLNVSLAHL